MSNTNPVNSPFEELLGGEAARLELQQRLAPAGALTPVLAERSSDKTQWRK